MVAEIEPDALGELLEAGEDVRVVDIRGSTAFAAGHIPGSEHVPMDRLPAEIGRFEGADHVVTVCPHGEASVQAGRLIEAYEGTESARVESLAGGISAWDGPLEEGPDEEGDGSDANPAGSESGSDGSDADPSGSDGSDADEATPAGDAPF